MAVQRVSINQAAANVLTAYLKVQFPDCSVESHWPSPNKPLTPAAITVIQAGSRLRIDSSNINVLSQAPATGPNKYTYLYEVCGIEQSYQLDVWAPYDTVRDDLIARLDDALSQGIGVTMPPAQPPPGQLAQLSNYDPVRDGVLFALGDGWTGTVDFIFDDVSINDDPNVASENEYRATYVGVGRMAYTLAATGTRMAHIKFKQKLFEVGVQPLAGATYSLQVDRSDGGVAWTTNVT